MMKQVNFLFLSTVTTAALLFNCGGSATKSAGGSAADRTAVVAQQPAADAGSVVLQPAPASQPSAQSAPAMSLLEAIEKSAEMAVGKLPQGSRVAIVAFESENDNLSNFIMDELIGALFDFGMEVADRQNLEYVTNELNFQMSGAVDDDQIQAVGRFIGADMSISGELVDAGDTYRYRVTATHTERGSLASVTRHTVRNDDAMRKMVAAISARDTKVKVAKDLAGQSAPQTAGAYLDSGLRFAGEGEYGKAIEAYTGALGLNPNMLAALYCRGLAYVKIGDNGKAAADFEAVLRIDPNHAEAKQSLERAR